MCDGLTISNTGELEVVLNMCEVGSHHFECGIGYLIVRFHCVEWWQIFRKRRIKRAIRAVDMHLIKGFKVEWSTL